MGIWKPTCLCGASALLQSQCVLCSLPSKSVRSILCGRNRYWHDISGHVATYRRLYSSKTEVPPTSTVRFVSNLTQCYQDVVQGVGLEMTNQWYYGPRSPLTLRPVIFSLGIFQRPGIRPTITTRPRWPKCKDHCSSEEYRCTHVDACVARTWISYRCVPCHQRCTRRPSLVVQKTLFQPSCGCEQFH